MVFLVAWSSGCANQLLLYPSREPLDAGAAKPLLLGDKGSQVEVYVARSPGATTDARVDCYCLEFCGNASRAEDIAESSASIWGSHRVEVWAMNYPGYGNSSGPAALDLIRDRALATFDQLKIRAAGKPILVAGRSLGTATALCVAARRPVAGLILHSPVPLQRLILWHYGWWNLWILASATALSVPGEMNALSNSPHVKAPAVFLITRADTLVPPDYQMMVYNTFGGIKHRIDLEDAGHNSDLTDDEKSLLLEEMEWLWKVAGLGR